MKTRSEYMDKQITHRAYYAQFVTPYVKSLVRDRIGIDRLMSSKDEHFNDIPLAVWDSFWVSMRGGMHIVPPATVSALLREAGEVNSASTGTCILKEAAKQLLEDSK